MRLVNCHFAVRLLSIFSIAPCCWPFSPLFFLPCLSYISLSTQSSHLCRGLTRFLQPSYFLVSDIFRNLPSFIVTMCSAHFIRFTILPTIQYLDPTSFLMFFILLLSTLFTLDILLIQLFSHTCWLCCYNSDRATAFTPYVIAVTTE